MERRRPNNFGLTVIIPPPKVLLQGEPQKAPSPKKQQLPSVSTIEDLDLDPDKYISQVLEIFKHFGQYY